MRKYNFPLIFGALILLIMLTVMMFPKIYTDKSPYNMERFRFSTVEGKLNIEAAPHPPSVENFMGSDEFGRDIYSRIIYGTRVTIILGVLIAIGRFLLAIPMALSGGFGSEVSKSVIKQFNTIFSAIPAILISIIILSLDFFGYLSKVGSIVAFVIVLSLVSWANLGDVIMERVVNIRKQSFIKSETAIGKKRIKIALENVIPHMAPELIVLFFMEIARALSMLMQLGIFSVFIGNLKIIMSTDGGGLVFADVSFEPEWASMLGSSRNVLSTSPWALLYPALAFFICVLGFNLFGEGLRNVMQRKDSKVIPAVRNIISFNIVKIFKTSSKAAKIKFCVVITMIISVFAFQNFYNKSYYRFEIDESVQLPYESVIVGTDTAYQTAKILEAQMIELGMEQVFDDGYIMEYEISKSCINVSQEFKINGDKDVADFRLNEDYAFVTTGNFDYTAYVYDATLDDFFNMDDYEKFDDKFVLIDKAYYNDAAINYFTNEIDEKSSARGVLLVARETDKFDTYIQNEDDDMFVLLVRSNLAEAIQSTPNSEITVSASIESLGTSGNNIMGIHKGTGALQEEAVIIAMGYNYLDSEGAEILQFNLELMRRLCTLYENKRSIIFVFIDGGISDSHNGTYWLAEDFPYAPTRVKAYIDLMSLTRTEFDKVRFSAAQAPFTRQFAWSVAHQLENGFDKNKIEIDELETMSVGAEYLFTEDSVKNTMFWERGLATIIIGTDDDGDKHNIFEIGSIILEVINKNNY